MQSVKKKKFIFLKKNKKKDLCEINVLLNVDIVD